MFNKSRGRVHHFFIGGEQFRKEVKRQIRLLIVVTLGFTMAFSWRQTVFDIFQTVVHKIFTSTGSAALSILTSLAITIISILLIFAASYLLQDKNGSS
jgi:hypothetical protein